MKIWRNGDDDFYEYFGIQPNPIEPSCTDFFRIIGNSEIPVFTHYLPIDFNDARQCQIAFNIACNLKEKPKNPEWVKMSKGVPQ